MCDKDRILDQFLVTLEEALTNRAWNIALVLLSLHAVANASASTADDSTAGDRLAPLKSSTDRMHQVTSQKCEKTTGHILIQVSFRHYFINISNPVPSLAAVKDT